LLSVGDNAGSRPLRVVSQSAINAANGVLAGLLRPDGRLGQSWKDGRRRARACRGLRRSGRREYCPVRATFDSAGSSRLDGWPTRSSILRRPGWRLLTTRPTTTRRSSPDRRTSVNAAGGRLDGGHPSQTGGLTGDGRYRAAAEQAIGSCRTSLHPTGFASWRPPTSQSRDRRARDAGHGRRGHRDAHRRGDNRLPAQPRSGISPTLDLSRPLLVGRAHRQPPDHRVCRDFARRLPVTDQGPGCN
jgi:hypothetical protein